jgi:flavin-dependent dehydrogenase
VKGCRLVNVQPAVDGAWLTLHDVKRDQTERLLARVLVGADGSVSRVAKALSGEPRETVPLAQAVVEIPTPVPSDVTEVWFDPATTPYFYWLIPESPDRAAVGLIGGDGRAVRGHLEAFLERRGLRAIDVQAARVPVFSSRYRRGGRLGGCEVYLVGDAAGHVKITTVGGLVSGLWGARAAAAAILEGTSYGRELWPLRRELAVHRFLRLMFNRFQAADYDDLLRLMNPAAVAVLRAYTRDELAHALVRLVAAQPRFIGLAARLLFR